MKYLVTIFLFCSALPVLAQEAPPFYKEILAFKQQDSLAFPAPGQVLFIGSSSFVRWKDVQDYFPGIPILNRSFGASRLEHLAYYQHEIIYPYRPSRIVIYCGENDFADQVSTPANTVVARFIRLFTDIRTRLPKVPVVYVSIKPSPSRRHLMPKFLQANMAIRNYLKTKKATRYLDVYHPMLLPGGQPDPVYFMSDSLHMSPKGYALWQRIISPALRVK